MNELAWRKAGGAAGVDEKGFSVTTDRAIAAAWASFRAAERGGRPVVLEAEADALPLQGRNSGDWTDESELFVQPRDYSRVGPGLFQ